MKPRLIVLEGMDSTGKSTLARFLAGHFEATLLHASGNKTFHGIMEVYHQDLLSIAEANLRIGRSVIMDRHWPSEFTYGRILRPVQVKYDFSAMHEKMQELEATYIFCKSTGSYPRHLETHTKLEQYPAESYFSILSEYNLLFDTLPHVKYNLEEHGLELLTFAKSL
jgi:hypothetical protein